MVCSRKILREAGFCIIQNRPQPNTFVGQTTQTRFAKVKYSRSSTQIIIPQISSGNKHTIICKKYPAFGEEQKMPGIVKTKINRGALVKTVPGVPFV